MDLSLKRFFWQVEIPLIEMKPNGRSENASFVIIISITSTFAYQLAIRLKWVIIVTLIRSLSGIISRDCFDTVFLTILCSFSLQIACKPCWGKHAKMTVPLVVFLLMATVCSCVAFDCPEQCKCGETVRCRIQDLTILKKILPENITRLWVDKPHLNF